VRADVDVVLNSKYNHHLTPSPLTPMTDAMSPETEESMMTSSSSGEINVVLRSSVSSRSSYSMDDSPSRLSADGRGLSRTSPNSRTVACMTDIESLVRKVKNVRIMYTPETCV
jgi:hypothetical protein